MNAQKTSRRWLREDGVFVGLLALTVLLLQFLTNGRYGAFRDEFYYLACGENLAWGYVDHPPLIALLARLTRLLGDSLFALRLLPALANSALVLLTGLIARELDGGRFAQGLAAASVAFAPIYLGTGGLLTMNGFEQVFWTLGALLLARLFRREEPKLWVPLGGVFGLGLLNKHSMLFFGFGLFVGLLLTRERRQFCSRWFWLGCAVAVLLFLPNLLWEIQTGWPTLEFMRNARLYKNSPVTPGEFVLQQILQLSPPTLPLWLAGLGFLLFAPNGKPYRPLGWMFVMLFVVFMATQAKAYYLAPIYPMLFAAGGVANRQWEQGGRRGMLRSPPAPPLYPRPPQREAPDAPPLPGQHPPGKRSVRRLLVRPVRGARVRAAHHHLPRHLVAHHQRRL